MKKFGLEFLGLTVYVIGGWMGMRCLTEDSLACIMVYGVISATLYEVLRWIKFYQFNKYKNK